MASGRLEGDLEGARGGRNTSGGAGAERVRRAAPRAAESPNRACGTRSPVRWGGKVERVTPCVLRRTGEGWALEASL